MAVGNNRKRFECLGREFQFDLTVVEPVQPVCKLGKSEQLKARSHSFDVHGGFAGIVDPIESFDQQGGFAR